MKHSLAFSVILLICAGVLLAGCTGTTGSSGTSATGSSTASGSSSAANNLVVSPTDALSSSNDITVTVKEKDYLGNIPVVFDGGTGQIHVRKIEVTLYRADGQVKTATVGTNKEDSVEVEGTKQTDRVVVYVTFDNGQRLKTNDVMSAYRTRP
jgi:hypothetical protein